MEPKIKVGIVFAPAISFQLNGPFLHPESGALYEGDGQAILRDHKLELKIGGTTLHTTLPFNLEPVSYASADFVLKRVTIGIDFHWERKEDQRFKGGLRFIEENGKLTAINILNLEDYLTSVISSEMSATSSMELLKAHAVISRSWLLAQIEKGEEVQQKGHYQNCFETTGERIKWYDREDHTNFDVCADDHCQRYQGITRASTREVVKAIAATNGQVLAYQGKICDARFSKCCGGVTELFENTWEPVNHPYLAKVIDNPQPPTGFNLDLTVEANADKWIRTTPEAFCNTTDGETLSQVLNDYDQETPDFFRWRVTYTQAQVLHLLKTRIGLDVGDVLDLIPVERGESSRLVKLKIAGSKATKTIGKELEIRKALSQSHLYSSAFVVDKGELLHGVPQSFTLIGAGWGHGVGLCQIGAAVMGARGYSYEQILSHYFPGAALEKKY